MGCQHNYALDAPSVASASFRPRTYNRLTRLNSAEQPARRSLYRFVP
jgi:hypothetical protein